MLDKHQAIIDAQLSIYNAVASKPGISSNSAVLFDDLQSLHFRYYELLKFFDLNSSSKSLLDLGCGNAELYRYLNARGFRGEYCGYDINDILLEQGRSHFKNIALYKKDILTEKIDRTFDYVVICGLFNVNGGQTLEWVQDFLSMAFSFCNEVLAFNLISTYVNERHDDMFYVEPEGMLKFCINNLSRRVTVAHHNLPYNYTVFVYKDENWTSVNR